MSLNVHHNFPKPKAGDFFKVLVLSDELSKLKDIQVLNLDHLQLQLF